VSLSLYFDEHVRAEITAGLRGRGIDVLTAFEDGHDAQPDDRVLRRATELGRVLFSQDSDMLAWAAAFQRTSNPFSGLVYAHQLAITIGQCIADLELLCRVYDTTEMENRVIYLPL
jgi:hypothetical protein